MAWRGRLQLQYRHEPAAPGLRTVVLDRHEGPLRVLASLYPEGPAVCHNVLVHPPGGIVGGDTLAIDLTMAPDTHALITTPGATRFYRSGGAPASQTLVAQVADGARLEWLPLETIAYAGCEATNALRFELAPQAELIGWDVLALGLAAAGEPFDRGRIRQRIELPGRWLDEGLVAGDDRRLLESPLGFAGHPVLATLWFAAGSELGSLRTDALLAAARACSVDGVVAGTTAPERGVVVLRALAARVEPAMQLLVAVRGAWRQLAWGLPPAPPRIWRT
jgi:urease accessory protein